MSDVNTIFNSASTGNSERFTVRGGTLPTSVIGAEIGAADTVKLQTSQDNGATFIDVGIGGSQVGIGAEGDSNVLVINQPGVWRVNVTNVSGNTIKITTETPQRK